MAHGPKGQDEVWQTGDGIHHRRRICTCGQWEIEGTGRTELDADTQVITEWGLHLQGA
jgi:hypothetical protein